VGSFRRVGPLAQGIRRLPEYRPGHSDWRCPRSDPVVVAGWMSEVQGERLEAEAELIISSPSGPLSADEVRRLVDSLGDMAQVLAEADGKDKANLYSELGISLTYDPELRKVTAQARLPIACATESVGGA
jgi:hypothetical protein